MAEYGRGELEHGSTGETVTRPDVARAIAASEQRRADRKKRKAKKGKRGK
jgi:hypothetical protein